MPVAEGTHGGKVYTEGSEANAYDQVFRLDDGRLVMVITMRIGEEGNQTYVDMTPDVAERIQADLRLAIPNAKAGAARIERERAEEELRGKLSYPYTRLSGHRRPEVRVRGHERRSR